MEMPLNLIYVDCGAFLCDLVEVGGGRSNRASLHCGFALLVEVGI